MLFFTLTFEIFWRHAQKFGAKFLNQKVPKLAQKVPKIWRQKFVMPQNGKKNVGVTSKNLAQNFRHFLVLLEVYLIFLVKA